jgi:outer membrane receptor protein involved in Fe transport
MACLAAFLMAGAAWPSHAQQVDDATVDAIGSGAADTDTMIVVTGLKFERTLQDTPESVRIFTAVDIERQNLLDVYDIIDRTANLSSTFNDSGFNIRGIANTNVSGTGLGDLATVYLDGSPLPREAASGGPLNLWDLQQVEILRGPQSTLQGRNALAGAIILNTADPSFDWRGRARAMYTGRTDEMRFGAALGGPLAGDVLAFRLAGEIARGNGLIENRFTGIDYDQTESELLRAKLLLTPSGPDGLRITAAYLYNRNLGNDGRGYVFTDVPNFWEDRFVEANRPTFTRTETNLFTLDASLPLSDVFELSSTTTYNLLETFSTYDGDLRREDEAYGSFATDQEIFSEELRLTFDTGTLSGVLGAYYSRLQNPYYRAESTFSLDLDADLALTDRVAEFLVFQGGFDPMTAQAVAQQVRSVYTGRAFISSVQRYPLDIETMALFGDANWEILPGLRLLAGFRYDREEQRVENDNTVTLDTPLPDPADFAFDPTFAFIIQTVNDLLLQDVQDANSTGPETTTEYEAFLPKAGLSYEFSPDMILSAIIQRGYRSGGSGINPARAQTYAYDPEYTWNYELSLRTQWLDRRLTLNANAFYIDWTDQQVLVYLSPNRFDYETQNAGKSRVWGFEIESSFDVTNELNIYGAIGFADSKFLDFTVTSGDTADLSGFAFAGGPRWTASAGLDWRHSSGISANLNVNYRSAQFQFVDMQAAGRDVPARTLVNARIGWNNENFGAYIFASNIFDEEYFDYQYENAGRLQALLGEPRMIGISLEGRF